MIPQLTYPYGIAPTDYTCEVWKDIGGWFATFHDNGEIADEFGLNTLPLGFKMSSDPTGIVERMQVLHPNYSVSRGVDRI
jgi:hypothetical protein